MEQVYKLLHHRNSVKLILESKKGSQSVREVEVSQR